MLTAKGKQIVLQVEKAAEKLGGRTVFDAGLLEEVVNLVNTEGCDGRVFTRVPGAAASADYRYAHPPALFPFSMLTGR